MGCPNISGPTSDSAIWRIVGLQISWNTARPRVCWGKRLSEISGCFLSNPEDTAVEGLAFVKGSSLALGVQLASPSIHYPFVFPYDRVDIGRTQCVINVEITLLLERIEL